MCHGKPLANTVSKRPTAATSKVGQFPINILWKGKDSYFWGVVMSVKQEQLA